MRLGLLAVTAAGWSAATMVQEALPNAHPYVLADLPRAWQECDALVCFLATGAVVRLVAPLLEGKGSDPGVVCVDEARQFAVALLGGHSGGANDLADDVAGVLGARAVVTTASDATGLPGLDTLGWPVEGAVAAVGRAMLDGEPVRLEAAATWPLPPLPVGRDGEHVLAVTDRLLPLDALTAVLRPPSLVVGVGASTGVTAEEVEDLLDRTLTDAGLSLRSVAGLATATAKAAEPGIVELARRRGWPVTTYDSEVLAAVDVPNPSAAPLAAIGTPSVAEAAASLHGELIVTKTKSAMATVAVARVRPRGRLALVGLGPGARDLLSPRAVTELRRASVWVGLDQYVDQVRDLARPGTRLIVTGLGQEQERALSAVHEAQQGHAVALLGSGDSGVYAMASPALEAAGEDIDVVGVPGITAALAAGSLLGAPLGHDHASISLSDLHTPWPAIEARVRAVAEADLVVTFYNPRSRGRDWQLVKAVALLRAHRPASTPVGIVTDASRPTESVVLTTLDRLDVEQVTMLACVVVGSSQSRVVAGRFVTPRGYTWRT